MAVLGIYEARTRWSEVLSRVEHGERFTITRHGIPIAELIPSGKEPQPPLNETFARMRARRSKYPLIEGESLRDLIREGQRFGSGA